MSPLIVPDLLFITGARENSNLNAKVELLYSDDTDGDEDTAELIMVVSKLEQNGTSVIIRGLVELLSVSTNSSTQ
jgi:hypothetical protein